MCLGRPCWHWEMHTLCVYCFCYWLCSSKHVSLHWSRAKESADWVAWGNCLCIKLYYIRFLIYVPFVILVLRTRTYNDLLNVQREVHPPGTKGLVTYINHDTADIDNGKNTTQYSSLHASYVPDIKDVAKKQCSITYNSLWPWQCISGIIQTDSISVLFINYYFKKKI